MNARLYDPVVGRFLSPDPYVQAPDFTQAFNRYSYAWNNPFEYVDEDGEWIWVVFAVYEALKWGMKAGVEAENNGGNFWKDGFWKGALVGFATGALGGSGLAPLGTEWLGSLAWGAIVGTASQAGTIWAMGGQGSDYNKIWQGALIGGVSGFMTSEQFGNLAKGKGFNSNDQVLKNFEAGKYGIKDGSTWQQDALDYFGFEGKYQSGRYDNDAWFGPETGIGYSDNAFGDYTDDGTFYPSFDRLKRSYMKETFERNVYLSGERVTPDNPVGIWDVDRLSQELKGHIYEYKNTGLYPDASPKSIDVIHDITKTMRIHNQIFQQTIFKNPTYETKWWHFIYKIPRRW